MCYTTRIRSNSETRTGLCPGVISFWPQPICRRNSNCDHVLRVGVLERVLDRVLVLGEVGLGAGDREVSRLAVLGLGPDREPGEDEVAVVLRPRKLSNLAEPGMAPFHPRTW